MLAPTLTISTMILSDKVRYKWKSLQPAKNSASYKHFFFALGGCILTFFSAGAHTISSEINLRGVEWSCLTGLFSRLIVSMSHSRTATCGYGYLLHSLTRIHWRLSVGKVTCTYSVPRTILEGLGKAWEMQLKHIIVRNFSQYRMLWEYASRLNPKKWERRSCLSKQNNFSRKKLLHENASQLDSYDVIA